MSSPDLTRDWAEFDPVAYLDEYYGDIGSENLALLRFMAETCRSLPEDGILLDFGGGPTIYPLISAAGHIGEIHFSDYLEANLNEVRSWLDEEPAAFDWDPFIRRAIELETGKDCSDADVAARAAEIRKKVTRLVRCDASRAPALEGEYEPYDVILTNFCAESATSDRWQWQAFMVNIVSLLKPGGRLIMSALKGATRYSVGERSFPAVDITEDELLELLEEVGFPRKSTELVSVPADRPTRDYQGLILVVAEKERGPGAGSS